MVSIKLVRFPTHLLGLVLVANESEVTDRHDATDGVRSTMAAGYRGSGAEGPTTYASRVKPPTGFRKHDLTG